MVRVMVTGAAGFIGSHITEELLNEGHEVVALDDMSFGKERNLSPFMDHPRFRFLKVDIRDEESVRKAMEGVRQVYHQAAIASVPYSVEHPEETDEVNRIGTLNILEASLDLGVEKVVLASSSAIYGNDPEVPKREDMTPSPESPYARQKLACEHYAQMFTSVKGLPVAALRYFNVFGPRQDPDSAYAAAIPRFITRFRDGRNPTIYGDGEQTRDFIFVKDVVRANIHIMNSDATGIFNVGCGGTISINDIVRTIATVMGSDIQPVYEEERPGDVRHSRADVSKIGSTGFTPSYTLRDGLLATVDWFLSH